MTRPLYDYVCDTVQDEECLIWDIAFSEHAPVTLETLSGLMWAEAKIVFAELGALGYGRSVSGAAFHRWCIENHQSATDKEQLWSDGDSIRGFLDSFDKAAEIKRDFIRIVNNRRKEWLTNYCGHVEAWEDEFWYGSWVARIIDKMLDTYKEII